MAVNPVLDAGLGFVFVLTIAKFVWGFWDDGRAVQFFLCLCMSLALMATTSFLAGLVGNAMTRCRRGKAIPANCRDPLGDPIVMKKWRGQAWQLAIHLCMAVWELRLLQESPGSEWWSHPELIGCPGEYAVSLELEWFMLMQLALWVMTGISHKWFDERRKDYVQMMIHHIVTVMLVITAINNGEHAFGLVVLVVHDTSDIVIDLLKMANYMKLEDKHGFFLTEVLFVTNTFISWPYMRLFVFPAYVISGEFFGYQAQCVAQGFTPTLDITQVPVWITGRALGLSVLCGLHFYWWSLFLKMFAKLVKGVDAKTIGEKEYEKESSGKREKEA